MKKSSSLKPTDVPYNLNKVRYIPMKIDTLQLLPLWAHLPFVVLLLAGALEAGYRLGCYRHHYSPNEKDSPVGTMVASILGLLALVLGFTFSLAASRFDDRRRTVLEEANAIGTAYLRTQFLPEPHRGNVEKLLREYVDIRVQATRDKKVEPVLERSELLHQELWSQASLVAEKNPGSIMHGLFIQSLNEVIDVHSKRVLFGLRSQVPLEIWLGLYCLSVVGLASVGYQAGLTVTSRSPAMLGLVVSFGLVLYLIADLDRSAEGLLQVSQAPMLDLQKSIHAPHAK